MADRSVTVRLRADIDQYKRAMRDAANTTRDTRKAMDGFSRSGQSVRAAVKPVNSFTSAMKSAAVATGDVDTKAGGFKRLGDGADSASTSVNKITTEMLQAAAAMETINNKFDQSPKSSKSAASGMDALGKASRGMGRGMSHGKVIAVALGVAVAALGPLAALAAGAIGGMVGTIGTVALAWSSFNRQMEEGTALGQQMTAGVDGMKSALADLADIAAESMSGGLLAAMNEMETRLPSLNGLISEMGSSLGNAAAVGADALLDMFGTAGPLIADATGYVEEFAYWLHEAGNSQEFEDFINYARDTLPEVVDALVSFTQGLADLGQLLAPVGDGLVTIIDWTGKLASGLLILDEQIKTTFEGGLWAGIIQTATDYAVGAGEAKVASEELATGFELTAAAATTLSPALLEQAKELDKNQDGFIDATEAAEGFARALRDLNQPALDLSAAQIAVEQALDDATGALKENGKNLDISTQKGRDNKQALDDVAQALNDEIGALQADGAAHGELQGKLDTSRAKLEATARKFGMSAGEARAYANDVLGIPETATTVVQFNSASANGLIANYKASLASIPRNVHTSVTTSGGRRHGTGITFASGGYTGQGGKYDAAGVVHKGEFVQTQEVTSRHRGLLEWMHAGHDPRAYFNGYASGGYVTQAFATPPPAPVKVNVTGGGGGAIDTSGVEAAVGRAMAGWKSETVIDGRTFYGLMKKVNQEWAGR